jgi:TonB family protein
MLAGTQKRKKTNSTKVNLILSLAFHGIIVIVLLYFAAREGLLGKHIKKIAVEMVKEKPPEKPKEPEKPKIVPKVEPTKTDTPKMVEAPRMEQPKETTPPPPSSPASASAPPVAAPPAADIPSFAFEGGKAVETTSDPIQLYKGLLENTLRFNWERPKDMDDHGNVAEVEIAVDKDGDLSDPVWKRSSGQRRWDDSVRSAIASTPKVSRPPPANFPSRVVIRFDVEAMEPLGQ